MKRALAAAAAMAVAFALGTPDAAERSPRVKKWDWTFQADTLGKEPANTGVFGGRWAIAEDSAGAVSPAGSEAPPVLSRVLRQNETDDGIEFHYIQFKKPVIEDLVASVRFRILSGEIDPSAGLMFQLDRKGKSGYMLRASGRDNRLIAHYLLFGRRRDLRHVEIPPLEAGAWHTLSVFRKGSVLVASYDGVERFRIRDERFRKGSVGLWTEDDTVVEFAGLTVSTN